MPKCPLGPSNSTAPKRPPNAPQFVHIGRPHPQTKNRPYLGHCGSKRDFERTESTRNHPPLVVSTPQNCANGHLDLYLGPVGCGKLQEVAQRGGCQNGSTRSTGCGKKKTFFTNDPLPHGMPKQVFLARFELVVARFGPPKIPKCLFGTKNGSRMGQKCVFPKMILDHLGAQTSEMSSF